MIKRISGIAAAVIAAVILSAAVIAVSATPTVGIPFEDVPESEWYYSEIAGAYGKGFVTGRSANVFAPEENITRAEIATLLSRVDGAEIDPKATVSYPDVRAGEWYVPYLAWATTKGILKGYPDGTAKPNAPVTRAEMAVMLARYASMRELTLPAAPKTDAFSDVDSFKNWYFGEAETLRFAGIFGGDSARKFNPDSNATRAEVAALAVRFSASADKAESTVLVASGYKNLRPAVIYADGDERDASFVSEAIRAATGKGAISVSDSSSKQKIEIVLGDADRPESEGIVDGLGETEYRIRVTEKDGNITVAIGYRRYFVLEELTARIIDAYYTNGELRMPKDLDTTVKVGFPYEGRYGEVVTESDIPQLRDPFVLEEDGVYYVYGTGWRMYKNTSGDLAGPWEGPYDVVEVPADCKGDKWAPEVHKYNGKYYMFTTYRSRTTDNRGCAIFRANSPEGPFKLWSDGHVTPADWYSIDGTLYIDPNGDPWMVFVHEHVSTDNKVGRMDAAHLDPELKGFVSEPVELFTAHDPVWTNGTITDGPFMYTCEDGSLLMIWSNYDVFGYCVAIAKSESGDVTGPWAQIEDRLYSYGMFGTWEGGHGMIFRALDGNMYLSYHSPNDKTADRGSVPCFMRIREENGLLVPDFKNS
ncbi:MAG: S-layer homology domain-containing protein [Clostridia bacterium]|nr:S-layer homology domain-containing protein [Clostridia bacterium]